MGLAIAFIIGVIVGSAVVLIVSAVRARGSRDAFAAISQEVLAESGKQIVTLAEQVLKAQTTAGAAQLEGKKELIDQSIAAMNERLESVRNFVQQVESQRQKHQGELAERLATLSSSTESLRNALAGSKRVGAWGERMTEDVLRAAGMREGINYLKQSAASAESGTPDFTFLLPNELKVNMDVKFPMEKGLAYLDAADDDRDSRGKEFVTAVRGHIRALAGRAYIDPTKGTVDYVIMFMPNEQLYSLALGLEPQLMDDALTQRVVLCGPLTLYAVLVVIRQSAENANVMKTAGQVIELLAAFEKQWQLYAEVMDKMGKRIDQTKEAYEELVGTRSRMLERHLAKIDELRASGELPDDAGEAGALPAGADEPSE